MTSSCLFQRVCDGYQRSVYLEDVLEEIKTCKKQHQYDVSMALEIDLYGNKLNIVWA